MFYNGSFSLLLHGWILNFVQIKGAYKSEVTPVLELATPEQFHLRNSIGRATHNMLLGIPNTNTLRANTKVTWPKSDSIYLISCI